MSAHDRFLASYSHRSVQITCRDCGSEFVGEEETEYGQSTLSPEECPHCGCSANLESETLSDYDIQELRAEARGDI